MLPQGVFEIKLKPSTVKTLGSHVTDILERICLIVHYTAGPHSAPYSIYATIKCTMIHFSSAIYLMHAAHIRLEDVGPRRFIPPINIRIRKNLCPFTGLNVACLDVAGLSYYFKMWIDRASVCIPTPEGCNPDDKFSIVLERHVSKSSIIT